MRLQLYVFVHNNYFNLMTVTFSILFIVTYILAINNCKVIFIILQSKSI